jgi:8-oxo-dGTP diphosphatase
MPTGYFRFIAAVHLFLIRNDAVLLLRRANTGYADGQYSVIAGHLNGDEQVVTAAIREANEEAGVVIDPSDIEVVGVMHRKLDDHERIDFFLTASRWRGEVLNREPDKCDDLSWFSLEDLPDNVVPYVLRAIANYRAGVRFDSFGWDEDR